VELVVRSKVRQQLVEMFECAVDAVAGYNATKRVVGKQGFRPDLIIAVGKAASGMCAGALSALADQKCHPQALLVTKYQHTDQTMLDHPNVTVIEAAHPVPDEQSLVAGAQMLSAVNAMAQGSKLLLLVSGGTSSLAEHLPQDISLSDWQVLTDQMLSAGFNIGQINARRKETSLLKDGKLLQAFDGSEVQVLAISDVEGDAISVIGSGTGDTKHSSAQSRIELIGTNRVARLAAQESAERSGYSVQCNIENMYRDVNEVAVDIGTTLLQGNAGVYIFGGEPTVELPENPGSGGRNQALALSLSEKIAGRANIHILVAGTDGSDGPTNAAGGIVDGNTASDPVGVKDALARADAGSYLRQSNDIFITGPTNTNVMDVVIAIIE